MPLDYTILNNNKSLLDQQNLQDAFNQKKALALQALSAGAVDEATKQNALKYQTIAAGAANGADGLALAKAKLGQLGIDSSEYSDDPTQAANQALTAQKAASPYGTIFNGTQAVIANDLKATEVGGPATKYIQPVLNPATGAISIAPASAPPAIAPPPTPIDTNSALTQPDNQGSIQVPVKPTQVAAIDSSQPAVNISAAPTQKTLVQPPQAVQQPDETNAQFNARAAREMEAYKASPAYLQSSADATAIGKNQADASKNALESDQNYQKVSQTLDAIKQMAPTLPQQENFIGPDTRAFMNQNLGHGKMAADYSKFKTINEAQTLGAIQTLADTGQIRMTRTLENIINRGFLVDPNLSPQGKIDQANAIQAELRNAAVAPANVNAQMSGGQTQSYSSPLQPPPSTVAASAPSAASAVQASFIAKKNGLPLAATQSDFNNLPSGAKYVEPDGNIYIKP